MDAQNAKKDKDNPDAKDEKQNTAKEGKSDESGTEGLSASHPTLKKLEQLKDDTKDLIRAQLYLQAQQKEKPKKTENAW